MNAILLITYPLNSLLMLVIPIVLAFYLTRKFKLGWRLWWLGAGTFVLSQLGHIPFNRLLTKFFQNGILPEPSEYYQLAFNAIVLGLSAGLWEECARYVTYRWWAKNARSWSKAVLMGAGHGGIEAIILGILALIAFIQLFALRTTPLTQHFPPEQLELAQNQINAYWSTPWFASILGAFERVFALTAQIALSIMVLQTFIRNHIRWLLFAIGWHALIDALAIYILNTWGPYFAEAILFSITLINLALIFTFRKPNLNLINQRELSPLPREVSLSEMGEIEATSESLEQTRYNS